MDTIDTMDTLPAHLAERVVALLDHASRAAASRACRGLRDAVAAVRCRDGVTISERALDMLRFPRYELMSRLRVRGSRDPWSSAPSPCPVPRAMPHLRVLAVDGCRVPTWGDVVTRAPGLRELVVRPAYGCLTYRHHLESCLDLVARAPGWRHLTRLELRGDDGPVLVRYMVFPDPVSLAFQALCRLPPVVLPSLLEVAVTGRQVCPAVDAPLRVAVLDDPDDVAASMVARMGPLARPTLRRLTWSLCSSGVGALASLHAFAALNDLHLTIRDVWDADVFSAATHALAQLPPGLTSLGLAFGMDRMAGLDPELRCDACPLAHLAGLRELSVTLSFPARGCEDLVAGLLGAPPTLRVARVHAQHGPAWPQRAELHDLLATPEFDDPDAIEALELEIEAIEAACRLGPGCLDAARARFPAAVLDVRGL